MDELSCVFIHPDINITDIIAISLFVEDEVESIPNLEVNIGTDQISLAHGVQIETKLTWVIEWFKIAKILNPNTKVFTVNFENISTTFDLTNLIFLGPTTNTNIMPGILFLELTSGFYCNPKDFDQEQAKFNIDLILSLDYRNVTTIKTRLDELDTIERQFEQKQEQVSNIGIDISELREIQQKYEDSKKLKRRVQYQFMQHNDRQLEESIAVQHKRAQLSVIEALKQHIETNRSKKPVEVDEKENYSKLMKRRISALNELKMIFSYSSNKELCTVRYSNAPSNANQFNEMRAFLGFATHYIKEVSRVLGIALPYVLHPQATYSKIESRISEKTINIPTDFSSVAVKQLQSYESTLVEISQTILKFLFNETSIGNSLTDHIERLRALNEKDLVNLIPVAMQ